MPIVKRTLIKDRVGAVRTSSYDLPTTEHIYGKEVKRDDEGAGKVVFKWVQSSPSEAKESSRSFVETNKRAIILGHRSAKSQRQFALENPDIRERRKLGGSNILHQKITRSNDVCYGQKTNRPSENIRDLIQNKHSQYLNGESDYPDLAGMQKKGHLPAPKDTRSSRGKDIRLQGTSNDPRIDIAKEPFKMKKFVKVGARIPVSTHRRDKSRRLQAGYDGEGPPLEVGSPIGRAEDEGGYDDDAFEPTNAMSNAELEEAA